jgi:hypothetical protein
MGEAFGQVFRVATVLVRLCLSRLPHVELVAVLGRAQITRHG